jgi:hypothetical protein
MWMTLFYLRAVNTAKLARDSHLAGGLISGQCVASECKCDKIQR